MRISNHSARQARENTRWIPPSEGFVKINTDASLKEENTWGLGAICRDHTNVVLAAATWKQPGFQHVATAEAFGIYLGLNLAVDCCFSKVIVESYSEVVIKMLA